MEYKEYLKSEDWKEKKKEKYNKPRLCAICATEKNLDVHHLNYKDLFDVEMSDLRVLCRRCHFLAHELHKQGRFRFNGQSHHSRFAIIKHAVKKALNITNKNMFYA